jgi:hypothetical protein
MSAHRLTAATIADRILDQGFPLGLGFERLFSDIQVMPWIEPRSDLYFHLLEQTSGEFLGRVNRPNCLPSSETEFMNDRPE